MKIKNKLSLEKESILTLNEVNMEEFKGGVVTDVFALSSGRCADIFVEAAFIFFDFLDYMTDPSSSIEGTPSASVEYGGCVVSDVKVCS